MANLPSASALPPADSKNPYRLIGVPRPLSSKEEADELLAKGRELIDNQLWLASEWLLTTELLAHQQQTSNHLELSEDDIEESVNHALYKAARQIGRSERADQNRFRVDSYERRAANLEHRSRLEGEVDFKGQITTLRAAILRYEKKNKSNTSDGLTKVVRFDEDPVAAAPSAHNDGKKNKTPILGGRRGPGARPRPNPDVAYLKNWPSAMELHAERTRRFDQYAGRIASFEHRTAQNRMWFAHSQTTTSIRAGERSRLAKEIPALEAQLAKARQDLADMAAADRAEEQERGEVIRQGRMDAERLEGYRRFLNMDGEVVPDLDTDGFVLGGDLPGGEEREREREGEQEQEQELGGKGPVVGERVGRVGRVGRGRKRRRLGAGLEVGEEEESGEEGK